MRVRRGRLRDMAEEGGRGERRRMEERGLEEEDRGGDRGRGPDE